MMTKYTRGPLVSMATIISLGTLVLTVYNFLEWGVLDDLFLGKVVGVLAFTSFACAWVGWYWRRQRLVEMGLLTASLVWVLRGAFILATDGLSAQGVWFSAINAAIAGKCFWSEVRDPHDRRGS